MTIVTRTPSVCVLVLNYNGVPHLQDCLSTLGRAAARAGVPCPIVLVDNRSPDVSVAFTRQTMAELLVNKRFALAFQLARQVSQVGDDVLADESLNAILNVKATRDETQMLRLAGATFLAERNSFARADSLVQKVLEDSSLTLQAQSQSALWRWRAELTQGAGKTAASIACLEKALDLEYADLPEIVNLDSIRADYRTLLGQYLRLAEALALLEGAELTGQQPASAKLQAANAVKPHVNSHSRLRLPGRSRRIAFAFPPHQELL